MNTIQITDEKQILLQLIRTVLSGQADASCLETDISWTNILRESRKQTVTGLLASLFSQDTFQLPATLKERFSEQVTRNTIKFHRHLHFQDEAIQKLHARNISVVVLKGFVAAANYPVPEYRAMGDIDLLILPKDFDSAKQCLLDLGYQLAANETGELEDWTDQKHLVFQKEDILLELHVKAFRISNEKMASYLQTVMIDGFEQIDSLVVEGYTIPILPTVQNALEFLLHVQEHLYGVGIGLRQIIDWSLFVEKHITDEIYENKLQPVLVCSGLETFAKTLTRMCQLYLGLSENTIHWCREADENLCAQLMEFILTQGNFGKNNTNDNGARALSRLSHPTEFLKNIQIVGLENFPKFRNHKILRYFAWLPQLGKYITYVFANRKTLSKDVREGKKRRQLFDGLKVFEK